MTAPRHTCLARPSRHHPLHVALSLAVVCATACGGGGDATPTAPTPNPTPSGARNAVAATPALTYSPATITIVPGDSVTWAFGTVAHTVTFDTQGAPAEIPSTASASVARVFPQAGTFAYHCTIHPGMTGEVRVQ